MTHIRLLALVSLCSALLRGAEAHTLLFGQVTDPQKSAVPNVRVLLIKPNGEQLASTSDAEGRWSFQVAAPGTYTLEVGAPAFAEVTQAVTVGVGIEQLESNVSLGALAPRHESLTVTADAKEGNILFPDPSQQVFVRQELLDANPGRPGNPISIPGVPVETASGGIKAPQYFSPGVAGDHGEPIAQYLQIGTYLLSNNLSSNAHGNGYADPNIMIPAILEGVQTDGGAFNVREGNHAESLSTIYQIRSRLEPLLTLTGDYRDVDLVGSWSAPDPAEKLWIAAEAAYGNGFLQRLEHRQQYKVNVFRQLGWGKHQLTLFGIGYYGSSFVPGLVPLYTTGLPDTIDRRQRDQTHTGEFAANDVWKLDNTQQLHLSGSFRTYNLALLSNFGDGLIRQSEFRTVTGGNILYLKDLGSNLTVMAGADYQRDAPRRLNLDHYDSENQATYGLFQKLTSNNLTLGDVAPYLAVAGSLFKELRYNLGWRRDQILFDNTDLLNPLGTYNAAVGFNSPKATLSFVPETHRLLPAVAFSFGEAFFTNDPRTGIGTVRGAPISREHSYQVVVSKRLFDTDFRVTLGHITTEASLAKIDADTGLQEDEGPGRNRFITVAARRYFRFGSLQASVSKADARALDNGLPIPEAPRLIVDVLGTVQTLPFQLQARAEYEQVGAKPLGDGFVSVPVQELRGALFRSFANGRMDLGCNFLIASGYTGRTTEVLALPGESAASERIVGVYLPSYVSVSYSYHLGRRRR